MIPEQLDLFGGPPRPPKKIREEEPAPEPVIPEAVEEAISINESAETADQTAVSAPDFSAIDPVSPVISWMEPEAEQPVVEEEQIAEPIEIEEPIAEMVDEETAEVIFEEPMEESVEEPLEEEILEIASLVEEPALEVPVEQEEVVAISSKEMPIGQLNIPPDEILFKRQYYSMRETAGMFDITHSMLRYWENEFDILQPRKNKKGDRYFRPIDVKNLQLIYHLLKVRKFTLDGAREFLRNNNKALDTFELIQKLEKVKSFLHELKAHL